MRLGNDSAIAMQFILINRYGTSTRLQLGPLQLGLFVILTAALATGVFYGGVQFAQGYSDQSMAHVYDNAGHIWRQELAEQREQIASAKDSANQQLSAMAARLSKLQGHIFRLDALGARLANMADLEDFDFGVDSPPGMGGPMPELQTDMEQGDLVAALDELTRELDERADKLTAMERLLMNRNLREDILPAGSPVRGGWVSSLFGMRSNPISGRREMHTGIDFAGKVGTHIHSVAAGVVTYSGRNGGYGNMVEINHGDGYVTRYAHNRENLVSVGERVDKGAPIALMGDTGRSTGVHLHFEVMHDGKTVNPKQYISVN